MTCLNTIHGDIDNHYATILVIEYCKVMTVLNLSDLLYSITPLCDTALKVESLMERRYRACDNQSHITLDSDTEFPLIRMQTSCHVIKTQIKTQMASSHLGVTIGELPSCEHMFSSYHC